MLTVDQSWHACKEVVTTLAKLHLVVQAQYVVWQIRYRLEPLYASVLNL